MTLDRLWAGWRLEYIEQAAAGERSGRSDGCVFCSILASAVPDLESHIVWRHPEGRVIGILNAYPYASGHLMVMPTRHVGGLEDLEPDESAELWAGLVDGVAALRAAYRPDGVNVGINLGRAAGAGVPGHLHVHAVPRWSGDTNFMTSVAEARVMPESLDRSAEKIRSAWP